MNIQSVPMNAFSNQNLDKLLNPLSEENKVNYTDKKVSVIVPGNLWVVDNYLTDDECDKLIAHAEKLGFETATLNVGNDVQVVDTSIRDCKRCMIDDFGLADLLLKRVENTLPKANEGGILSSINERFRILKYNKNNQFKTHSDGLFFRQINEITERSVFTLLIYLNDNGKEGETIFYNKDFFESGEYRCKPKKGRVAIFRQFGFLHCGDVVDEIKYAIRTDIMYRKYNSDEKLNAMKDKEYNNETCKICNKNIMYKESSCTDKLLVKCECINYLVERSPYFYCVTCDKGRTCFK